MLFFSRHLVVARRGLALAPYALVGFLDPLLVPLGLLGVLLGERPVLGRLAPLLVDRLTELLGLGGVRIGLLAVAGGLAGEPLALEPSLLRAAAQE